MTLFNGCYCFLSNFVVDNCKEVWDSDCEDLHFVGNLPMKQKFNKMDEFDGHLEFHGNSSRNAKKAYDTEDESKRHLEANSDLGGSLYLRVSPYHSSHEIASNNGSLDCSSHKTLNGSGSFKLWKVPRFKKRPLK